MTHARTRAAAAALLTAAVVLVRSAAATDATVSVGREVTVSATLFKGPERAGALEYLGGARLVSPDPDFRGLSGVQAWADGRLVAVTDRGHLFEAKLVIQEFGIAVEGAHLFALPRGQADERNFQFSAATAPPRCAADRPRARAEKYDAEAVAALGDDFYAVAFERNHRIQCYRRLDGLGGPPRLALEACPAQVRRADEALVLAASPNVRQVEGNCGIESLAYDRADGVLLMLSERPGESRFPAWAFRGDEPPYPLRYHLAPVDDEGAAAAYNRAVGTASAPERSYASEYRPSDMALLGDDLLALERYPLARGGPYVSRLMLVREGKLSAAGLAGDCLTDLRDYPPANYEALAAVVQDNGERWLYVVSDDGDDRAGTVLLLFRLRGSGGGGACPD